MKRRLYSLLLGLLLGLALLGGPVYTIGSTLDLPDVGERSTVIDVVEASRSSPSARFEDSAGLARTCSSFGAEVGDVVLHDATRCRLERYVGLPNPLEWVLLVSGGCFCLLGVLVALESEPESSQEGEQPPRQVRHTVLPEGDRLVLPWRHTVSLAGVMLQLMLIAGASAAALVFPAAIVVAFSLLYSLAYTLVNATTIDISDGTVNIHHGPLPSFTRNLTVPLADLDDLRLTTRPHGRATYQALTGGSRVLLHHWSDPEPLAYVKRCIDRARRAS